MSISLIESIRCLRLLPDLVDCTYGDAKQFADGLADPIPGELGFVNQLLESMTENESLIRQKPEKQKLSLFNKPNKHAQFVPDAYQTKKK